VTKIKGVAAQAESRAALIATLNHAAREASGLGAVFGEAVARRVGIDPTALECLGAIAGRDDMTAGALAAAMGLTTGAVTGVVDRLEKAGLARRVRDGGDRRKVFVRATPKALGRAAACYASLGRAVDALAAAYTDAEIALIAGYFARSRDLMLAEIAKLNARREPAPARLTASRPRRR
jgi:DNA-binding MarR family transcriptional regulator